jgi:type IV secretory pathway TraG/TraD family ATPase VirD4
LATIIVFGALFKISKLLVNHLFTGIALAISPSAWWRGGSWLWWQTNALLERQHKDPEHAEPVNRICLPPYIRTRSLRAPVLEERFDGTGAHVLVVGPPGAGKSSGPFLSTLLGGWTAGGSALINDVKGEFWAHSSGFRAQLGRVLKFAPSERESCRLNLLAEVRLDRADLVGDAERLAHLLLDLDPAENRERDPYWRSAAARRVQCAIIHVRLGDPNDGLAAVARLVNRGDAGLIEIRDAARHPFARDTAAGMLGTDDSKPDTGRLGVAQQALNALSVFFDERVAAATSGKSDLALSDLQCAEQPVSLYLCSSLADRTRLAPLTRALLGMTASALTAHENTDRSGRRKRHPPLLMAIDEAPSSAFKGLADAVALSRSYKIVYMAGAQSRAQLRDRYGPAIVSSFGVHVDYRPSDLASAQELAGIVGKSRYHERVTSTTYGGHFLHMRSSWTDSTRRVETDALPAEQLLSWEPRRHVLVSGQGPVWFGHYAPAFEHPEYRRRMTISPPDVAPLDLLPEEPEIGNGDDDPPNNFEPIRRPRRGNPPVAMVQGNAYGGGFEMALSCDVIIAERQAKFGFPEVLFGLFAGMGAYSLLCRRLDEARARRMILSGKLYSAQEMHEAALVDVLAAPGEGPAAVRTYLERHGRRHGTVQALRQVREICQPVSREELIAVTDIWVETALGLGETSLRAMERLARAQLRCGHVEPSRVAAE